MRRLPILPALAVAGFTALGIPLAVHAQPTRLIPNQPPAEQAQPQQAPAQAPQEQAPTPAPQANTPPINVAPAAQAQSQPQQQSQPGGVRIEALNAPDPSSTGLLGDSDGGLGIKMWAGTSREQAIRVMGLLPSPVASPGLRQLQRRLLLTAAEVPPGSQTTPPSLLALRVRQLYRLGYLNEATQLGVPRPPALRDQLFTQLPISLALLKHDIATACQLGDQALREDPSNQAWLRVAVFCRYKAGNHSGGELALNLWRDQGGEDTAFQALAAVMGGDTRVRVEKLAGADALILAMLRETKRPIPPGTIELATMPVLAALPEMPDLEPEARLLMLERGVALGATAPARLISAYTQLEITDAQRADIAAGKIKGARAAAHLFQQARGLGVGPARAEAMKRVYELAISRGTLFVAANVLRDSLRDLPAEPESMAAAPAVIRLALAAGEIGTARLWRNSLLNRTDPASAQAAARAWPLMLLAEPPSNWSEAHYQAWSETLDEVGPQRKASAQSLMLILAEASGIVVPSETWQAMAQPDMANSTPAPPVAYWRNLLRAAEAGAKAETVALALTLLGGDGMTKDDPASLATAFGALKRVKLEQEVRGLALEAALSRGL